jgi:hypothetical protein
MRTGGHGRNFGDEMGLSQGWCVRIDHAHRRAWKKSFQFMHNSNGTLTSNLMTFVQGRLLFEI